MITSQQISRKFIYRTTSSFGRPLRWPAACHSAKAFAQSVAGTDFAGPAITSPEFGHLCNCPSFDNVGSGIPYLRRSE